MSRPRHRLSHCRRRHEPAGRCWSGGGPDHARLACSRLSEPWGGVRVSGHGPSPVSPHDLRHTHVAMLIAEGQSPRYIADRLGHESTRTVLDVYGHLYEGLDEVAMAGLERLRSETQTDTRRTPDRQVVARLFAQSQKTQAT